MTSFLNRALGLPPAIPSPSKTSPRIDHHGATSSVLRRTLSAVELCPGPIKKIEDDGVGSGTGDFQEVWSSIRKGGPDLGKNPAAPPLRHSSADVWGSILSEKAAAAEGGDAYVHPLVKRSTSCLSEKSLEICTESLGSETGADVFSSEEKKDDAVAVVSSAVEEKGYEMEELEEAVQEKEDVEKPMPVSAVRLFSVRKVATVANRAASTFPPPLPSLGQRGGGNVRMMSHRENGRLVLEAVSVPTRNCFRAERQGGRLLLTFSGLNSAEDDSDKEAEENEEVDDQEDGNDNDNDNDEEVLLKKEIKVGAAAMVMENVLNIRGGVGAGAGRAMLNCVHYKFLCLTRTNSGPWSHRLNKVVNNLEDNAKDYEHDHLGASPYLIPSNASLNKYVYSWRTPKPTLKDSEATEEGVVVVEAAVTKGTRAPVVGSQYDELLPFLRGCNKLHQQQPKRASLLLWDTAQTARCIVSPS